MNLQDLYGMDPVLAAALGLGQDQQKPTPYGPLLGPQTEPPTTIFLPNQPVQILPLPSVNVPTPVRRVTALDLARVAAERPSVIPKEAAIGPEPEPIVDVSGLLGVAPSAPTFRVQAGFPQAGAGEVPFGYGPLGPYPGPYPYIPPIPATPTPPTAGIVGGVGVLPAVTPTPVEEVVSVPAPSAPEEIAAVQVKQALAVQALAPEQPNWWENLQLVTKAAAQPPLVSPEEFEQQVAIEQAQKDRADYLDQELAQQMKTPDEQVLQWLGSQGTGVENWDALSGFAGTTGVVNQTPPPEPATPEEKKKKLVSTGITKMIDSLADDDELGNLATRLNGVLTGGSLFASPDDDGRIKAIMAKVRVDPDIMTAVISNVSKRMYSRPGLIPLGSLGRLPSLIRL